MIVKRTKSKTRHWRIHLALFFLLAACAGAVGRLFYLQIVLGERYQVLAQGFEVFARDNQDISRGEIFFAGGQPLAINKDFFYCYASPMKIKDKEQAVRAVAEILGLEEQSLRDKFEKESLYAFIKEKLGDAEIEALEKAAIEGIYVKKKKMRYYPQGEVGGQLAGFVDDGGTGRYGLEDYYNDKLSAGESIFLNIDHNLQYQAQRLIAQAKEDLNAVSGEAIVANPKTGAILAMAETPNFDPNDYKQVAKDGIDILKNDSCQTLFEPGSVFKAITMASALNEKKVTPETDYVDSGMVKIGGWPIYNYGHRAYGRQTMTNVLEHSVNTGVVFAQSRLGNEPFVEYLEKFGIFEPTGIDLPETFSANAEFKKGYAINYATASFGQGIWMTSIQLIRAYSALANGGVLIRPSVAKTEREETTGARQVIDPETSKTIAKMLASVVDNGFGKSAKIKGYSIAGKTGTAQMAWSTLDINEKGYSDKTTQSFIGFFPAEDPQFLILVKLVAPEANTAEYSSLPVFKELAQYAIYLSQIPPSEKSDDVAVPAGTETAQTQSRSGD